MGSHARGLDHPAGYSFRRQVPGWAGVCCPLSAPPRPMQHPAHRRQPQRLPAPYVRAVERICLPPQGGKQYVPLSNSLALVLQRNGRDTDRQVDARVPLDTDWLQRDRLGRAADQHIGIPADASGCSCRDAAVIPSKRASL
jgi:hypothetical protein